ncbi:MAG: NAD-glutamate dehydrogenase [Nevskia sp.]|nr:NAD-glutamate dehydrogenase [Nevskia sp.]
MNDSLEQHMDVPEIRSGADNGPAVEPLIEHLDALAQAQAGGADLAQFRGFLRRYFEMAALDTLKLRSPQELLQIAQGHWDFARVRRAGVPLVRVLPPQHEDEARAPLAVVETCVEDQPFLVDTIAMAVRAAGAAVDWTVHPVLRLQRDAAGAVTGVAEAGDGPTESLIHLEFEPLAKATAYAALEQAIRTVLGDLRQVVDDYPATLERVRKLVEELKTVPPGGDAAEFAEAREFLGYLDQHHFTFLGKLESRAEPGADGRPRFRIDPASGLGLLRAGGRWASEDLIAPEAELNKYSESPRLVVVTKANLRSPVHRDGLMDVVSVKRYHADGSVAGTVRFFGLFSSEVYIDRPRHIPLIRRKADHVLQRSRLQPGSHSYKNLRDILHGLPRDELFQTSEEQLYHLCMGIRALRDRQQLRLFMRRDRYGRFYSFLVYVPRERYSRELRDKIGAALMELCGGLSLDREIDFLRGGLTRLHCVVRTPPGTTIGPDAAEVEARLIAATRSWRDRLRELLLRERLGPARFSDAFPLSYAESVAPEEAAADVACLAQLSPSHTVLARLTVTTPESGLPRASGLKLYAWHTPVPLSDVLPTLENFGLRVIRQEPAEITPKDSPSLWVQEFEVQHPGCELAPEAQRRFFESGFLQVWRGEVENDGLNRLVLGAGLDVRQVTLLRAVCKYLIQTGLPFSQPYMEALLAEHADIARLLVALFETRFALRMTEDARRGETMKFGQALDHALDQVASLDGDRVLRAFLGVIRAMLRTNYFQRTAEGQPKHYVSFKLDPARVPELPLPRPMFEIWVYAPEVEGIHVRGGRVARGGLRWSDRRQDFRTEILGLMKAQMVKNTVIVPVGAKGGFVVKKPVDPANREAWLSQGIACYKTFLRGLLDITDNRVGDAVVPPPDVLRQDEDDPYLVVAADKGTATFSDIANSIAAEYGFWLGDAFASGGSAGYDHKKMGITARGAWESVKRHFRELGRDIQAEPFTVAGIGDMSGDVFGNGMLLSRQLRLLAAFDHRHIFIDPDPDPATSFAERERLFRLPRSSWADYDAALLSKGGAIYPRGAKLIKLSEEARRALAIDAAALPPNELLRAILKAPVDLLWNGGIGTYVKAAAQSHLDVGDRANDAIRVNGRELRCKVLGEGGNLGCTQLGRIEYALAGGRLNTDAIDNAGGVHTSDREVNIKIPLNQLMAAGKLSREERDPLLAACTPEIAHFVLYDNYVQSAAISLLERNSAQRLDDYAELMRLLERGGLLNRAIEFLPDEDTLKERRTRNLGLTRPELAVLIAYSKISLNQAVLESEVPDDPFFVRDLLANFPHSLVQRYPEAYAGHRLKREIVATILSNALVNRMGAGFAQLWAEDHGLMPAEVLKAYATAHQIYGGDRYWQAIEALDNRIPAHLQYRLMGYAIGLLKHATGWFTSTRFAQLPVQAAVDRFGGPLAELEGRLPELLPPAYREDWDHTAASLAKEGVPEELARRLANTRALGSALDIAELAESARVPLAEAAAVYYLCGERFRMLWLYAAINQMPIQGKWQSLARVNLRDDAYRIHRQLAGRVLAQPGAGAQARFDSWVKANERHVRFSSERLAELQAAGSRDFASLAVAVREVRKLRRL